MFAALAPGDTYMKRKTIVSICAAVGAAVAVAGLWPEQAAGQVDTALAQRIAKIMARPEFAHSRFGIQFYSMDSGKGVYELNAQQLFVPGSTTKLFTEGTALELLGADYRFHTRVYRSGPIDKDGTLNGDLILVAAGDPNLSNRIQSDGTMAFEDEDHSYGGPDSKGLPGDPLVVIRELAGKIAESKIKKINGRVLVDASLFPEGDRELGTGVVLSPIVVNDNVIDVVATPGASEGAPVTLKISPQASYATFVNQATTGKAGTQPTYDYSIDKANPDGTHVVTITGTLPLGGKAAMVAYRVPEPKRFAAVTLLEALKEKGVNVSNTAPGEAPDFKALAVSYKPENLVAEHVSPPLKEEVKVTLKVSQNLHASMTPSVLGSVLSHADKDIEQAGFDLENGFLKKLGLDLSGAVQSDGAGGNAFYTPDFVVRYLVAMSKQEDFQDFYHALPVLGKDGTLVKIQVQSPAAGHVHAKTGTYSVYDALNKKMMVTGKGLAGYMDTASGEHLVLALYANLVSVPMDDPEATQKIVGEALGEIASAAYDLLRGAQSSSAASWAGASTGGDYDVIIRNGKIIDGSGGPWAWGDIGIRGDRIAAIGKLVGAHGSKEIDAKGLVVSPGFIDMLGQSEQALLIDNRSLSKLSQGITSEITGEGGSIAPQNDKTLVELKPAMDHYNVTVDWTTLDEYYKRLQRQGTPLNIGTYVGAAQVREAVLGDVDRKPTAEE
jgi:PBP4 family serine-type D-alanyl-D-alanine carboxypeptidase